MLTLRSAKLFTIPFVALGLYGIGAAPTMGCASSSSAGTGVTEPVNAAADSSVVTADVTNIRSFSAQTQPGAIVVTAKDATSKEIASFKVTKVPVMNYWGGVMPAIVIEEAGASGGSMHAEAVSFYPDRTDLSRTEFELYGVGDQNVIIRSAYDADNVLTRVSLFAYKMAGAPGQPRLGKFLSGKLHSATPFDIPASYASIEDYVDAWIDATGTSAVWESNELDNVYFTMRDPTWIASVISSLAPTIVDPTTLSTVQNRGEGLHFTNTGGGTGSGSGGKGTGKPGPGSGAGKGAGAKPPKAGQASGCDKNGLGGVLGGILGNIAKNPTGSLTGAKACKACVSGLTGGGTISGGTGGTTGKDAGAGGTADSGGSTTTDSGAKGDGGAARPTKKKKTATKTQIVAAAKATKTPKKTSAASNPCGACQKFLGSSGITKAATCAIGKLTNGVFGKKKGGSATNSNNNSPADDMSDDCADDGSDCASAPDGDACTMGDDTCSSDPDQNTNDSGSFETGDVGDDGSGSEGDVNTDDFSDTFSD